MVADQNTITSFVTAQPLRHVSAVLSGVAAFAEALDTTFVSGVLSNIGTHLARADAALLIVGSILTLFLVARLMEDRRRMLQIHQLVLSSQTTPEFYTRKGYVT